MSVEIDSVLKTLNNGIRRNIIRFLHEQKGTVPYSEIMNFLQLPASSNVAYHLQLLSKYGLITKDEYGGYSLTKLGKRSGLLLELTEEKSGGNVFRDIYLGFAELTPAETLIATWCLPVLIFSFISQWPSTYSFVKLLLLIISISTLAWVVWRTGTIYSLLLFNNFLWVFFIRRNRFILFFIQILLFVSIFLITSNLESDFLTEVSFDIGLLFFLIAIVLSIYYLLKSYYLQTDQLVKQ